VLTNSGALDRDTQIAVVRELPELIAAAAGNETLKDRTWVLLSEVSEGGWVSGVTHLNEELVTAARAEIAKCSPEDHKGRTMRTSPLSVDVFVTPIRPYAGDAPQRARRRADLGPDEQHPDRRRE
jgi:phenylpyruvate tautomerase PptA (4-oxalocrotonate tautomerase family)